MLDDAFRCHGNVDDEGVAKDSKAKQDGNYDGGSYPTDIPGIQITFETIH